MHDAGGGGVDVAYDWSISLGEHNNHCQITMQFNIVAIALKD